MFNSKALLASTIAAVLVSFTAAAPAVKPGPDASVTVEVCSGSVNPANGCVTVPVVSDSCNDLTGGLSFLNKEISWAVVPGGFICTFFQDFGCIATGTGNAPTDSSVVLQQGTWDMFSVPGLSGTTNFNDLTSSFSCSPL
ncbi:hypothetical protein B0H19DRAFT_1074768 [Mycena capillaripes]|nr:hypothetical protein B0H19DRAFT_1265698 [Mycena capillaripes]KAJ6548979.1 hypothetical protein B0H19DRAFT_1074768 [Mycena capillaripes]